MGTRCRLSELEEGGDGVWKGLPGCKLEGVEGFDFMFDPRIFSIKRDGVEYICGRWALVCVGPYGGGLLWEI